MSKKLEAFSHIQIWYHKHIIHFMIFFILTGLPILSESFHWLAYFYGIPFTMLSDGGNTLAIGIQVARIVHRGVALMFILVSIPFLIVMLKDIKNWQIWPEGGLVDGVKQLKVAYFDFKAPNVGKYNFGQKALAWFLIISMIVMTYTGFVLMFRDSFSADFASVMRGFHAVVFILIAVAMIVHLYFAVFPPNRHGFKAMFGDGTMDEDYIAYKHPKWYKKLVK
jgi:formate dehydrogenase subunit gamma